VSSRFLVFVAVAATVITEPLVAQERREVPPPATFGTAPSVEDAAAIDTLIARYHAAWSRQDAAGLIALHASDVEWINAYARMFRGDSALADFLENRLFPAFDSAVSRQEASNMKPISRRYLGDDAAIVHMYTDGTRGESRNPEEDMRRTHLHLVLGKKNGTWKVVHTAIMDAR
jgi:uncharacterized protein (TIGR02246 family)